METACLWAGVGDAANKGRDGAIEFAPAWAPDSSATHCSLCHNVRFTTFNRRVRWTRCRGVHRSRPTPDGAIVVPRWALARPSTTAASAGAWSVPAAPTILFRFRRPRNGRTGCATSASLPPSAAAFGASCNPAWSVRKRSGVANERPVPPHANAVPFHANGRLYSVGGAAGLALRLGLRLGRRGRRGRRPARVPAARDSAVTVPPDLPRTRNLDGECITV